MTIKAIAIIGLLISIFFLMGFAALFIYNPTTFEELNNLSLASYNLSGMKGQSWTAYVIYLAVGLLNTILAIGLFKMTKNNTLIFAGKVLILLSGLVWTSLGIIPFDINSEAHIHNIFGRILVLLIIGPVGLIILGFEFEPILQDIFLKYYTLLTGLVILFIGFLSAFVFNDETWIRTNISFFIYFSWFGVFGIRLFQSEFEPGKYI